MPLPPLRIDEPLPRRAARTVVGAFWATVLFGTLLLFNVLQTASLVLWPFSRRAFRAANRWCANTWWGWCAAVSLHGHGTRARLTGDALPADENALVLCNHQSMTDIQMLFLLARRERRLGDMKWFVKRQLRKMPGVGWGMAFLDCIFVERDWTADREMIRRAFRKLVDERISVWLITFVEGTRIRPAKLERSHRWAAQEGIEPLRHLLLPRSKGFVATIQGMGDHLGAIYDVTIGYVGGVPSLWQWACGRVREVHLDVRRFPVADLPKAAPDLAAWLLERYRIKDDLLERFYGGAALGDASVLPR